VPKYNVSFIRIKRVEGKDYAYLVESRWYKRKAKGKGTGPRQKVSKYLGRVHKFDRVNDSNFFNFKSIDNIQQYLKSKNKNEIVRDLVEWELLRHNIDNKEFFIDFENKKILKSNNEVSLKINEGFLNSYTLNRLFNLNSGDSYYLAKCFVEAGIEIPKEVFVGMFE
jgi:hypothetical protein